jgi:hypothetical protein
MRQTDYREPRVGYGSKYPPPVEVQVVTDGRLDRAARAIAARDSTLVAPWFHGQRWHDPVSCYFTNIGCLKARNGWLRCLPNR